MSKQLYNAVVVREFTLNGKPENQFLKYEFPISRKPQFVKNILRKFPDTHHINFYDHKTRAFIEQYRPG